MKVNLKVRFKNPYFWFGLIAIILTAMGASPEMFTSWEILKQQFLVLVDNPFMLGTVIVAIVSYFTDHTTKGLSDSERALTYTTPQANCKNKKVIET